MIRPDLIFSYWVIIWYILYEVNLIKYNPKFWLIVAVFINFYNMYFMFYFKRYYMLFLFIIVVLIMKGIPIWTLRNIPNRVNDIIAGSVLFMIYYIWLTYNNETIYSLFRKFYISIRDNNPNSTPFMYFLNSIKVLLIKV
jgi:hypothetical protein